MLTNRLYPYGFLLRSRCYVLLKPLSLRYVREYIRRAHWMNGALKTLMPLYRLNLTGGLMPPKDG